jgi:serine/threonine protein kinase
MSVALKQFVQQLTSIDLLSADELRPFLERLGPERDAKASERLAKELIREKKLTAFQAQAALQGKAKNLLLGNYLILEKLGQGGMGMVLKARHKRMDRVVALKILSAKALQSPDAVKRFGREVQAAAKLHHPNIVTAFDADEALGTHFLVMEFVEGKNFSALVKEKGPLPAEQAVECILQAARGLEYAHGKGIVHRDIKPANLLLGPDGVVKILDMGLARLESAIGGESDLTGTGQIMGTVDYMAPEQAVNTKDADQRSDIYSLGITLWFLLTGRMAYQGDTLMAKLIAHREHPIPSLAAVLSGGPQRPVTPSAARLDAVFQKMVAKRPADRYPSMTHLIADLVRCQTTQAGPPTISLGPGEDSKFSAFLRSNSGGGLRGGSGPAVQTAARPATLTGLEETIVTSGPQGDTDPQTNMSLGTSMTLGTSALTWQEFRKPAKTWLRDWRVRVAAIGSVVGLSLLVGVVLLTRSSGPRNLHVAQNPLPGQAAGPPPPRETSPGPAPFQPTATPPDIAAPAGGEKGWNYGNWKSLFDGRSLAGWSGGYDVLKVENGAIVCDGQRGVAVAPGDYKAFELELEFRLALGGNSGVGIHYGGTGDPSQTGIEVQLIDDNAFPASQPNQKCGALYRLAGVIPGRKAYRSWPAWNSLRVSSLGRDLRVELNGIEVVATTRPLLRQANPEHAGLQRTSGSICLYPHTARSEYRNLRVREAVWTDAPGGSAPHTIVPSQSGPNRPAQEAAAAYNGHSYKFYPEQLTWKEAKAKCETLGGRLVIIDLPAENQFVGGLIGKAGALDAWIGITDEAVEGNWRTVTGQQQAYTNWAPGQPNDQGSGEDFALISNRELGQTPTAWAWFDQPNKSGTFTPGFICEWEELPMSSP